MEKVSMRRLGVFFVSLLIAMLPALALAGASEAAKSTPPPVSQPLVSEGDLAVKLLFTLGAGTTDDVVEAESQLGDIGITPRNGWIADYPLTPDIIAEVRNSVASAADNGKLSLARSDALQRYDDAVVGLGLVVKEYTGESAMDRPISCENYPNPAVVTTTYTSEGPPIVTYYCPPPDYYYLYSWVPYPFWWSDFWFPGFFILHDFHRPVFFHNRVVIFTNHFNDVRRHRVFRIDPVERFRGRTFAGIGVRNPRDFISTGVPHSPRTIFNIPRNPVVRGATPAVRGGDLGPAPRGDGGMAPRPRGSEPGIGGARGGGPGPGGFGGGVRGGGGSFGGSTRGGSIERR